MRKPADFEVRDGGTVYTVRPVSKRAGEWTNEHVRLESWQWLGDAFAVEHRYLDDLIDGIRGDGLTVGSA